MRPRKKQTGLPSYCYRDSKNGRLFMLHPAGLDANGKLRFTRKTYRDLDALLPAWRATWGEAASEGVVSMGQLFDAYLADALRRVEAGELSATSLADYTKCIRQLRPVWERVRVADVDIPMLYRWRDLRGESARVRCNRERTTLFEAFKIAMKLGLVERNPVEYVTPFREKPRDRYVTDAEFMAVYSVAHPIVQAAMLFASITGLRQGDILRIRRADFTDAGLTVQTRKTGQPLEFAWTDGLRFAVLHAVGTREFVPLILLATEKGRAYTGDGFRTLWQRAIEKALAPGEDGTPPKLANRFTFNDLRAKAGSESRDWKLLGHMDRRTFERVYNRLPRKVTPTR